MCEADSLMYSRDVQSNHADSEYGSHGSKGYAFSLMHYQWLTSVDINRRIFHVAQNVVAKSVCSDFM
jgi:hypothetical protein